MSLVFLDALVDPIGRPRARFACGALVLRGLGFLLWLTSIHGCCQSSSGWSTTAVIAGPSGWLSGIAWLACSVGVGVGVGTWLVVCMGCWGFRTKLLGA